MRLLNVFVDWRRRRLDLLVGLGLLTFSLWFHWPLTKLPVAHTFSAPLVPFLAFLGDLISPLTYARAVDTVVFFLFCLFPVSVYFFVTDLVGRRFAGLTAAAFSVLPLFSGSRIRAAFWHGDTAHILALTLMPVAALFLNRFLRQGGFGLAFGASLLLSSIALTSPFGLFVFFIFMVVVTFSEMVISLGRLKFLRFMTILFLGILLSQFWYTVGYIRLILLSIPGKEMVATLANLLPLSLFLAPILGVVGFLVFEKRPRLQPFFIAVGLVIIFWLFSFAGRISQGLYISHQDRYQADLAMAMAFLVGVLAAMIYQVLPRYRFQLFGWRGKSSFLYLSGLILLFVFGVFTSFGKIHSLARNEGEVLGFISDQIVGLGEIRQQTGVWDKLLGSGITLGTLVLFVWARWHFQLLKRIHAHE